jgi:NADH:ubiquinone oxidoreductase subunit 4 (subunit M)
MHNRLAGGVASREIGWRDGIVLAPLVLCILTLALYPQLILKRTDTSVQQSVAAATPKPVLASTPTGLKRPHSGRLRPVGLEER